MKRFSACFPYWLLLLGALALAEGTGAQDLAVGIPDTLAMAEQSGLSIPLPAYARDSLNIYPGAALGYELSRGADGPWQTEITTPLGIRASMGGAFAELTLSHLGRDLRGEAVDMLWVRARAPDGRVGAARRLVVLLWPVHKLGATMRVQVRTDRQTAVSLQSMVSFPPGSTRTPADLVWSADPPAGGPLRITRSDGSLLLSAEEPRSEPVVLGIELTAVDTLGRQALLADLARRDSVGMIRVDTSTAFVARASLAAVLYQKFLPDQVNLTGVAGLPLEVDLDALMQEYPLLRRAGARWSIIKAEGLAAGLDTTGNLLTLASQIPGPYRILLGASLPPELQNLQDQTELVLDLLPGIHLACPEAPLLLFPGRVDSVRLSDFLAAGHRERVAWAVRPVSGAPVRAEVQSDRLALEPDSLVVGLAELEVTAVDTGFRVESLSLPPGVRLANTQLAGKDTLWARVFPASYVPDTTTTVQGFERGTVLVSLDSLLQNTYGRPRGEAIWRLVGTSAGIAACSFPDPSGAALLVTPEPLFAGQAWIRLAVGFPGPDYQAMGGSAPWQDTVAVQLNFRPVYTVHLDTLRWFSEETKGVRLAPGWLEPVAPVSGWADLMLEAMPDEEIAVRVIGADSLAFETPPGWAGMGHPVLRTRAVAPLSLDTGVPWAVVQGDPFSLADTLTLLVRSDAIRAPAIADTVLTQLEDQPIGHSLGELVSDDAPKSTISWTTLGVEPATADVALEPADGAPFLQMFVRPELDFFGSIRVWLRAADAAGNADTASVLIDVWPVVDLVLPDTLHVAYGGSRELSLPECAEDLRAYPLTFSLDRSAAPAGLEASITPDSARLLIVPRQNWYGRGWLRVSVANADRPEEPGYVSTDSVLVYVDAPAGGWGTPGGEIVQTQPTSDARVDSAALANRWYATIPLYRFEVLVSTTPLFDEDVEIIETGAVPRLDGLASSLEMDREYYWVVLGSDGLKTYGSGIDSFYVGRAPLPFRLLSPVGGGLVRSPLITYKYEAPRDPHGQALRQVLETARDTSFSGQSLIERETLPAEMAIESAGFGVDSIVVFPGKKELAADRYYWRVTATDPDGFTTRTAIDSFEVSLFQVLNPPDGYLSHNRLPWWELTRYAPKDSASVGPYVLIVTPPAGSGLETRTWELTPPADQPVVSFTVDDRALEAAWRAARGPFSWQLYAIADGDTVRPAGSWPRTFFCAADPLLRVQCRPCPFALGRDGKVSIVFTLARAASEVAVTVYDMGGNALYRVVRPGREYEVAVENVMEWDGLDAYGSGPGPGVYGIQLHVEWEDGATSSSSWVPLAIIP